MLQSALQQTKLKYTVMYESDRPAQGIQEEQNLKQMDD